MEEKKITINAAICGDEKGVDKEASMQDAIKGADIAEETVVIPPSPMAPEGLQFQKTIVTGGEVDCREGNFNGFVCRGGEWVIKDSKINVGGAIGNDFIGLGAGILVEGDTPATIEGVEIHCSGAARTPIVAREKARIFVKDSVLTSEDGDLEPDYVGTVFPEKMKSSPWMLGVNGNARATNLMGQGVATYYNCDIKAEKWGVLSTDDNTGVRLHAINTNAMISGGMKPIEEIYANAAAGKFDFYEDELDHDFAEGEWQDTKKPSGYGTYSIGDTTVTIAGSTMVVPDYIAIVANGPASLNLTSSEPSSIAGANQYLAIAAEAEPQRSVLFSNRFGVMYHSGAGFGVTNVDKGTVMYTGKACFEVKGCGTIINVDDAHLYSGDGIILQVMDNDDAGIDVETLETTTDYVENHVKATATETATKAATTVGEGSVYATFSNMTLNGDIYNASGWEAAREADTLSGDGNYENEVGGGASAAADLQLVLDNVTYTGMVSTTEAYHNQSVVTHKDYDQIGVVNNTVCIPENAGIIVKLRNNTVWNVTGTGYVTSLTIDETSSIGDATVYINGEETAIEAGKTYTGVIRIEGNAEATAPAYVDPAQIASGC